MPQYTEAQKRLLGKLSDAVTTLFHFGHDEVLRWVERLTDEALNGDEESTEEAVRRAESLVADERGARAARAFVDGLTLDEVTAAYDRVTELPEVLFDYAVSLRGYRRTLRQHRDDMRNKAHLVAVAGRVLPWVERLTDEA